MSYCYCNKSANELVRGELVRGETPTYIVDFSVCEINTTDVQRAVLVIRQYGIERDLRDGIIIDNDKNEISYHFSQQDTLDLCVGDIQIQLDVVTNDGERCVASVGVVKVLDTLIDEVI